MDKVLAPLGLNKIVLKTESDFWFRRSSFLLKILYITKENEKLYLACYLYYYYYFSELEEEEKKNNAKEEKEKGEAEKFKREAVQVGISGLQSFSPIPLSLGQTLLPPPNPSVCSDSAN